MAFSYETETEGCTLWRSLSGEYEEVKGVQFGIAEPVFSRPKVLSSSVGTVTVTETVEGSCARRGTVTGYTTLTETTFVAVCEEGSCYS